MAALCSPRSLRAAGGDFSNDDLEFAGALPAREDLTAKLPRNTAQSGLRSGLSQQQQGLALGEPAPLYVETRRTADAFNAGLDAILAVIEYVRNLPPTTRSHNQRIWGPFPDRNQPGFEVELVMEREDSGRFVYRVEHRKLGSTGEWVATLEGTFVGSGALRKGTGSLQLYQQRARDLGLRDVRADNLEKLETQYSTQNFPTRVEMIFHPLPTANYTAFTYSYREHADGAGAIRFKLNLELWGGLLSASEQLETLTRWTPAGTGRADVVVVEGDIKGAHQVQCWDSGFLLVHDAKNWDPFNALGSVDRCPTVADFN